MTALIIIYGKVLLVQPKRVSVRMLGGRARLGLAGQGCRRYYQISFTLKQAAAAAALGGQLPTTLIVQFRAWQCGGAV